MVSQFHPSRRRASGPRAGKKNGLHYHVLVGLRGLYMPDTNNVHRTKKSAIADARWHAQDARDGEDKVTGNPEDGYEIGDHCGIEITTCTEVDCLSELDE